MTSPITSKHLIPLLFGAVLVLGISTVVASSGDRSPTFQQCLKGCQVTYCDPSQPPIAPYLRAFGWTCEGDCKYQCGHAFTDMIRTGSRYHQFYGKWAFYRLGPIQEPFSVLMSLGNLWAHWQGIKEVRRRVRSGNLLRRWLLALGVIQINTWIWSSVFHTRDVPFTERLDYFSATITIASSLLYTIARTMLLQTPNSTSKLLFPAIASIGFLVMSHFTYLLSFPLGQFPYGYHTLFNVILGMVHNLFWILWSLRFVIRFPRLHIGYNNWKIVEYPKPYPPRNPLDRPRQRDGMTPLALVVVTTMAMMLELLDFAPFGRVIDAHSLWHAATIPIALGWWTFLCNDAIELEGSLMGKPATVVDPVAPLLDGRGRGMRGAGDGASTSTGSNTENGESASDRRRGSEADLSVVVPRPQTPDYVQIATGGKGGKPGKESRQD